MQQVHGGRIPGTGGAKIKKIATDFKTGGGTTILI
jgi:hypothetical protein